MIKKSRRLKMKFKNFFINFLLIAILAGLIAGSFYLKNAVEKRDITAKTATAVKAVKSPNSVTPPPEEPLQTK